MFKQGRIKDWHDTEDQYAGKVKKTLKSRFNAPLPIMSGFEHTLLSKIDDPPALKYTTDQEAEEKAVKKTQAFYETISTKDDDDWELKDLDGKKQAIKYGRAIYKAFGESDPKFKFTLDLVDIYDFYFDPMGGADLENHRHCGQDNIFKSKYDLIQAAKMGLYERDQVQKILTSEARTPDNDNIYLNKENRLSSLNLDGVTYKLAGRDLYKFIEGYTVWNGYRFLVVFNYETGEHIRCEPLEKVFESELWPFATWAPYRDPFNFLSLAPSDEIRPIAEIMRVLANQELDNRNKINYGMRAFDPEMFPEPALLEYRPDGLVAVKAGTSKITQIQNGIYNFETPQLSGTIDIVNWLDDMLGKKSGVTADAQGASSEDKVGIYLGNIQQVADRLGLQNKYYKKCWKAIGRRFLYAVDEHLNEAQAVKMVGEQGVEWDELRKREVSTDWGIRIEGGNSQLQLDELKKRAMVDTISGLAPDELAVTSPRWRAETKFRAVGVEELDLRLAFDLQNEGSRELLTEAAQSIEDILAGKEPKLNRGANTAFVQKIMDYAYDTDLKPQQFDALIAYAEAHLDIAMENMARKAVEVRSQQGLPPSSETPVPATEQLAQQEGAGSQPMSNGAQIPAPEPQPV